MLDTTVPADATGATAGVSWSGESIKRVIREQGFFHSKQPVSEGDFIDRCQALGRLVPQYDGKDRGYIRPDRVYEGVYHTQNRDPLQPHTECCELDGLPPRYLALYCVHPDLTDDAIAPGCRTRLARLDSFFDSLAEETRTALLDKTPRYCSTPGLAKAGLGKDPVRHPLVEFSGGHRVFRFSRRCMGFRLDPDLEAFVREFLEYFDRHAVDIEWSRGHYLVWDNYRVAHARTKVRSMSRCLLRVWLDE